MKRKISISTMFTAILVAISTSSYADQVTLEPSQDNTLYESATGALSNGAGPSIFAGQTFQGADSLRRALMRFDLAGNIPPGSTITSVSLTLFCTRSISPEVPMNLHALTADWGEGSSVAGGQGGAGAPSTSGDATWIHTFFPSSFWVSPGGDFNATVSATAMVGFAPAAYTWESTDQLVADAQGFLDSPSQNFGWILIGTEGVDGTAKRFGSRENTDSTMRPVLTVDFCPPTPAAWLNYGAGWPGTGGIIPDLTAGNDPKVCEPVTINIGNSSGNFTSAFLLIGFASASIGTGLGGTVLVSPFSIIGFPLPGAGVSLPGEIPCDAFLCGISLFMQTLQQDPGASHGFSFSPGLELQIGS